MKIYKILIIFLFALFINKSIHAKPIPPGAGQGDVAANILFLVDSSDSMKRPIGGVGSLEAVYGLDYDSSGNILVGQGGTSRGLVRMTSAGARDKSDFDDLQYIDSNGCATTVDSSHNFSDYNVIRTYEPIFVENVPLQGTLKNIVFFRSWMRKSNRAVFGFSENGNSCQIVIGVDDVAAIRGKPAFIKRIRVKTINNIPYMFITGQKNGPVSKRGFLKVVNLNSKASSIQEQCNNCDFKNHSGFDVTSDGKLIWHARNGVLFANSLEVSGAGFKDTGTRVRECNQSSTDNFSGTNPDRAHAYDISIDPDDDNIGYISSQADGVIQKINLSNCDVIASIGMGGKRPGDNDASANSLDADDVKFWKPTFIRATSTKVIVGTLRGYADEFDKSKFTAADRDTAWLQQMGAPKILRWDGLKDAIRAVVNDTTLTSGAYFGFGHWNSGEDCRRKKCRPRGGYICHIRDRCDNYYRSWKSGDAKHPVGQSELCNSNSCLKIGVGPQGASKIMEYFQDLPTAWGTDANAFSQIALRYFTDTNAGNKLIDKNALDSEGNSCQLNYVIVIGDGEMKNTGTKTRNRLKALRDMGVKTLFVAYGGGISTNGISKFKILARWGSCKNGDRTDPECEELIESETPEELKQDLMSKIRQILADKLAFTAPSITATIQEGGALYQAQFAYEQFGEWRGKLFRKKLKPNGEVDHDNPVWNAADKIKSQSTPGDGEDTRKLWSALGLVSSDYGGYDNFSVANKDTIGTLMEYTGYTIQDYHNSTSQCTPANDEDYTISITEPIGEDGVDDDLKGLINFMKGNDYFDYNGNCIIDEVRGSVMGDIYHSQLIEVGRPDANLDFGGTNEEAYFRATNNYQGYISRKASRKSVIYVGSNSGVLHSIDTETGKENWGFVPPFVVSSLPQVMNEGYDGNVNGIMGGTNPIFGVDGSPIVHDILSTGFNADGSVDDEKKWRTILFAPYGRGGAGFSVLDVSDNEEPVHWFSILNDRINRRVLVADALGTIQPPYTYNSGTFSYEDSDEGIKAFEMYDQARTADGDDSLTDDTQRARANCVTTTGYHTSSSNDMCYAGSTYHFSGIDLGYSDGEDIPAGVIEASIRTSSGLSPLPITKAKMVQNKLQVTFSNEVQLIINPYIKDDETRVLEQLETTPFSISTSCKATGFTEENMVYNYSELGETWGAPRIARIPSYDTGAQDNPASDKYVVILPAGMNSSDKCVGSALYLISLESFTDAGGREIPAGGIYGAHLNAGPITIVDTKPTGVINSTGSTEATPTGSDIINSTPATPVVITPDTAIGIPWRGAMVYINDLEGKITKINLTSQKKNADLFDQTTLFRLDASIANARYSYFGMDAGIGVTNGKFYLFGSTGNFMDLGAREDDMDNILYAVVDPDYPFFRHLNGEDIPLGADSSFELTAHKGANKARSADNSSTQPSQVEDGECMDVTGTTNPLACLDLSQNENAWVIGLDRPAANSNNQAPPVKLFRKASASPTLFKGNVYFPVYQPPTGINRCNQGAAFICVADDECGTNGSTLLTELRDSPDDVDRAQGNICGYVRKGVLSELVIFGDKLFANVAGPSEDEQTLISILSAPGEVISNKGGWRDSSF